MTEIAGDRRVSAEELKELFRKAGCRDVRSEVPAGAAFDTACRLKGEGMLFCVGSLYLAGELKDWIAKETGNVLNYEEELKKFKPCLDVDEVEDAIYSRGSYGCHRYPEGNAEKQE